jgi:hypothetical protein
MGKTRDVVARFYERFGANDLDGAFACFAPAGANASPDCGRLVCQLDLTDALGDAGPLSARSCRPTNIYLL